MTRRADRLGNRGYCCIGLVGPKTPANVGSVLRAAACFGAAAVMVQGIRYKKAPTDTLRAFRKIPLLQAEDLHAVVPYGCVPIAVELSDDAVSLVTFQHPQRAFYVFGPEDGSLGESVISWCRSVVQIPSAYCLNLAAAVNVVLYDRAAKAALSVRSQIPPSP